MVKIANTTFENMLIEKLTDGRISAEFIEKTAQIFGKSENYIQAHLEGYLGEFITDKEDEWFYEVCWICGKEKLVHNDMNSSYVNPTFICQKCEIINSEK